MTGFNSLKEVQHFDEYNSNEKKRKKRQKKYSVYNFSEHVYQNHVINKLNVTNL